MTHEQLPGSGQPETTRDPAAARGAGESAVSVAAADAPVRPAPSPEVAGAYRELLAARAALATELDGLTASSQAALDIPAKVRKDPIKTAALAGGAGFLVLGGPRRVLRLVGRAIPGRRRDRYAGLLPDEIERVLHDTGVARDPLVREALERDFAEYLRRKGRVDPQPNARASLWRTYDTVAGPLGTVGARMLVEKLFAARPDEPAGKGARPGAAGSGPGADTTPRPRG